MKLTAILSLILLTPFAGMAQNDTLYVFYNEEDLPGYQYSNGDVAVEPGTYEMIFTEKFHDFAIVMTRDTTSWRLIGINRNMEELFMVYWYDNGPDYVVEDRFRIIQDGRIGYANEKGEIIITPQFACADPFEEGLARVTFECTQTREGEFTIDHSDFWFYIDLYGNQVEK